MPRTGPGKNFVEGELDTQAILPCLLCRGWPKVSWCARACQRGGAWFIGRCDRYRGDRWVRLQYISGMGANVRTLVSNTNATESTESKEGYAVGHTATPPATPPAARRVAPQCPPLTVAPIRSADDVAQ